jgi:hypothetical protein
MTLFFSALLALLLPAAHAAKIPSYDSKLTMQVPDSWSLTPGEAFAKRTLKPAFSFYPVRYELGSVPQPIMTVTPFVDGKGAPFEAAVRNAYAGLKAQPKPSLSYAALVPVKLGDGPSGFGYGAAYDGKPFDVYFSKRSEPAIRPFASVPAPRSAWRRWPPWRPRAAGPRTRRVPRFSARRSAPRSICPCVSP